MYHIEQAIANDANDRILSLRDVQRLNSLSKASIYRGIATGTFPRPVRLTPAGRRVGWRAADVRAWLLNPTGWHSAED